MKGSWKDRVIEFLIGNTRNKLTSLFLAVVVWAYAFGNTGHEESFDAFMFVEAASETHVVVTQEIAQSRLSSQIGQEFTGRCRVTLAGTRTVLTRFLESNPLPRGELKVERSGRFDLREDGIFALPAGLSIKSVDPSALQIVVEQVVRAERDIRVSVSGTPGPGFVSFPGGIKADPATVTIEGPESLLGDGGVAVLTQEIDIEGAVTSQLELTVGLVITGDDTGLVTIAPGFPLEAVVRIELQQNLTQVQAEVSVRYIVDEDVDLVIRGDRSIKVNVSGFEEAVKEWQRRVELGNFYLLVKVSDTGGESRNVPEEDVRWIDGSLPAGISRDQVKLERIILYSAKPHDASGEDQQK
ncbi:MAG: hypothetical protein DSY81_06535 [Bacillota bacterium]|nr:MAG: hypothetical protein DSY92_09235 [Planctomycetota bacterium]RUA09483.1 MAG: hypothetical protein DSY81_06535 [Bacillota bacterium]